MPGSQEMSIAKHRLLMAEGKGTGPKGKRAHAEFTIPTLLPLPRYHRTLPSSDFHAHSRPVLRRPAQARRLSTLE